jgi:hypothetical protein
MAYRNETYIMGRRTLKKMFAAFRRSDIIPMATKIT